MIKRLRLFQYLIPKIWAQCTDSVQVNFAPEYIGELSLQHSKTYKSNTMTLLKFDKNINVANVGKIIAKGRPENSKTTNPVLAAKLFERFSRRSYPNTTHWSFPSPLSMPGYPNAKLTLIIFNQHFGTSNEYQVKYSLSQYGAENL